VERRYRSRRRRLGFGLACLEDFSYLFPGEGIENRHDRGGPYPLMTNEQGLGMCHGESLRLLLREARFYRRLFEL
jgi:hypothetical protein